MNAIRPTASCALHGYGRPAGRSAKCKSPLRVAAAGAVLLLTAATPAKQLVCLETRDGRVFQTDLESVWGDFGTCEEVSIEVSSDQGHIAYICASKEAGWAVSVAAEPFRLYVHSLDRTFKVDYCGFQ
jgi:hypothetical protein